MPCLLVEVNCSTWNRQGSKRPHKIKSKTSKLLVTGQFITVKTYNSSVNKGVPSAVGFPHCAGSGEGLFLSLKPYPHKCAEAEARTRDLPVTDGRLYRCTRPALHNSSVNHSEFFIKMLIMTGSYHVWPYHVCITWNYFCWLWQARTMLY